MPNYKLVTFLNLCRGAYLGCWISAVSLVDLVAHCLLCICTVFFILCPTVGTALRLCHTVSIPQGVSSRGYSVEGAVDLLLLGEGEGEVSLGREEIG